MSVRANELIELLRAEVASMDRRLAEKPAPIVVHKPTRHVPTDVTEVVNHAKGWARWLAARVRAARPDLVGRDDDLDHQAALAAGLIDPAEVRLYQRIRALRSC